MDEERIKQTVLGIIEEALDAHELAELVRAYARGPRPTHPDGMEELSAAALPKSGAQRLLTRIVLGDLLDESILSARPQDRSFHLRLFFGELGRLLATDAEDVRNAGVADAAFTLASGLNFFFRAAMPEPSKLRLGVEVSRQYYAFSRVAELDPELVEGAAPLLAALMSTAVEGARFESVDAGGVFDPALHERARGADPAAFNIARAASFLCRATATDAVEVRAEVVT